VRVAFDELIVLVVLGLLQELLQSGNAVVALQDAERVPRPPDDVHPAAMSLKVPEG
jgi:hypothetical protein